MDGQLLVLALHVKLVEAARRMRAMIQKQSIIAARSVGSIDARQEKIVCLTPDAMLQANTIRASEASAQ